VLSHRYAWFVLPDMIDVILDLHFTLFSSIVDRSAYSLWCIGASDITTLISVSCIHKRARRSFHRRRLDFSYLCVAGWCERVCLFFMARLRRGWLLAGVVGTLVYGSAHQGTGDLVLWNTLSIPSSWASLAFLFLSHVSVLPMSQSLHRDRKDPSRFRRIAAWSYIIVTITNVLFGKAHAILR
jgi:hypothetical protein